MKLFQKSRRKRLRSSAPKIRKRQKRTWLTFAGEWLFKRKQTLFAITAVCLLATVISLIGKKTIRSPAYQITYISFSQESIAIYDDPLLYQDIAEALQGENSFWLRWFNKDDILAGLQADYPIVEDFQIEQQADQSFLITISFFSPAVTFVIPDGRRYASYQENIYELGSGNTLGSESLQLELPKYTTGLRNIEGIFYQLPETDLVTAIQIIEDKLGSSEITERIYLPGGEKLFLAYQGKRIYIDLSKDVLEQLQKLQDIEVYFPEYRELSIIDLGSTEDSIVR